MKKIILLFCFIATTQLAIAQTTRVDSLKKLLSTSTDPIGRYNLLTEIGNGYYTNGIGENTVDNNLEMLRISLQQKNDSLIAVSYNKAGDYYLFEKADFNTAMDYLFKGIPYAERANDKRWLSSLYIDIAIANQLSGNFSEELKFLKKRNLIYLIPATPNTITCYCS